MAQKGWLVSCFVALTLMVASIVVASPAVVDRDERDAVGSSPDEDLINDVVRLTKKQRAFLNDDSPTRPGDEGHQRFFNTWRDGRIPYQLAPGSFTAEDRQRIEAAMREIQLLTCISFHPRTSSDGSFIKLIKGNGCSSFVGDIQEKNGQPVTLARGCVSSHGIIVHELLHAIGLSHEQTAYDRDDYVTINFHNIHSQMRYNFDLKRKSKWNRMNVEYDYSSVMHYSSRAFSRNGEITIMPLDPKYVGIIGQRAGMGYSDVAQVNKLYNCAATCSNKNKCTRGTGHLNKDCKCICKDGTNSCDSTVHTRRPRCTNSNQNDWECYRRSVNGECATNTWMASNCAMTCDMCGKVPTTRPTTPTWRTLPPIGKCQDQEGFQCERRGKTSGQCDYPQVQMRCPKSCGVCHEIKTSSCSDNSDRCSYYADNGYCQRPNDAWMRDNCKKSCDLCLTRRN